MEEHSGTNIASHEISMEENILYITSIPEYLNSIGISTRKSGNKIFASSPFSRDTNWSFCCYLNTNSYFDFSTGHGGNIITLVSRINHCSNREAVEILKKGNYEKYKPNYKQYKEEPKFWENFEVEKYTNYSKKDCEAIQDYAKSRGITRGYINAVFFTREVGHGNMEFWDTHPQHRPINDGSPKWIRNPSIGFVHVDKFLKPCGIKFRKIQCQTPNDQSPRFSARGVLGFYVLENLGTKPSFESAVLYVVESESSANSLYEYLTILKKPAVIISRGGVSSAPKLDELPDKYRFMKKKIIIDYDGNEELYQERLKLYAPLKGEPIKLMLPKGEDINSLFCKGKLDLIDNLL